MSRHERIKKANKTYCDGCEQESMEVCSWDNMPGWQKFLKGEIDEAQLSKEARKELAQLDETFGKYLRNDERKDRQERPAGNSTEEKAKIANKIYKKACVESGMSPCFFKNFAAWQQFVHGEIGETEFYEKARAEIRQLGETQETGG